MSELEWSQWLDFDRQNIEKLPEASGVYVTHANMKILQIAGSSNLRASLLLALDDSCTAKSKRFRYLLTGSFETEKQRLLQEYGDKHGGAKPGCQ